MYHITYNCRHRLQGFPIYVCYVGYISQFGIKRNGAHKGHVDNIGYMGYKGFQLMLDTLVNLVSRDMVLTRVMLITLDTWVTRVSN